MNTPKQHPWPAVVQELEAIVGKQGVISTPEELVVYECDGLASYRQRPSLVVLPQTTEQVAAVVRVCDRANLPSSPGDRGRDYLGGPCPSLAVF